MQKHKFHLGQKVIFANQSRLSGTSGEYEVVKLLPGERGQFQYRLRSTSERHDRVAYEDQLDLRAG